MAHHRRIEKGFSLATLFVGLSEGATELLDAYGRWETLMSFPTIPILSTLFRPYIATFLVFIGAILWFRVQEKEHRAELEEARKRPQLLDKNRRPILPSLQKGQWWKPLLPIPAAFICAGILVALVIWFHKVPQPSIVFSAPVAPDGALETREVRRQIGRSSVKNETNVALVNNQGGNIGPVTISDSGIYGTPPSGTKHVVVGIAPGASGSAGLEISNVAYCNEGAWECLLLFVEKDSGHEDSVKLDVNHFRQRVEDFLGKVQADRSSGKLKNVSEQHMSTCRESLGEAEQELLDNVKDERRTVNYLRANPPSSCNF
jgi:hypothetical protein